ncbi:hypothetical protein PHAVU_008G065000 [Phaseolus vulgaris]|uniref:S-protein homolog n=1 Tax=Phaseolus vulgaris TaxID=3885 RepID=V7B1T4_PHAVU|nr:hypothetical protein PHAVU_008G065000g [Phaseolus vulgaris]ESW11862.1 hypothetical protein PHAVU_008G065000g [Phaseolus vulgaris]
MTIVGKGVSFLWVLILIVLSANNSRVLGQLIIEVTNALDNGSLDLTVACPNIDGKSYLLHPGGFHEWINTGASHMFNMYVPSRDNDCEECHWFAKETGPCRVYNRPNKPTICSKWD